MKYNTIRFLIIALGLVIVACPLAGHSVNLDLTALIGQDSSSLELSNDGIEKNITKKSSNKRGTLVRAYLICKRIVQVPVDFVRGEDSSPTKKVVLAMVGVTVLLLAAYRAYLWRLRADCVQKLIIENNREATKNAEMNTVSQKIIFTVSDDHSKPSRENHNEGVQPSERHNIDGLNQASIDTDDHVDLRGKSFQSVCTEGLNLSDNSISVDYPLVSVGQSNNEELPVSQSQEDCSDQTNKNREKEILSPEENVFVQESTVPFLSKQKTGPHATFITKNETKEPEETEHEKSFMPETTQEGGASHVDVIQQSLPGVGEALAEPEIHTTKAKELKSSDPVNIPQQDSNASETKESKSLVDRVGAILFSPVRWIFVRPASDSTKDNIDQEALTMTTRERQYRIADLMADENTTYQESQELCRLRMIEDKINSELHHTALVQEAAEMKRNSLHKQERISQLMMQDDMTYEEREELNSLRMEQ